MRVQGALSSLTKVLSEATLTSLDQFDIVETICKLLYKNRKNQEAFIQMDGYSIMQKMFDKITTGPEKNEFLENCFQAFFILILDGHKDQVCGSRALTCAYQQFHSSRPHSTFRESPMPMC